MSQSYESEFYSFPMSTARKEIAYKNYFGFRLVAIP
jgi:hypothetical protein